MEALQYRFFEQVFRAIEFSQFPKVASSVQLSAQRQKVFLRQNQSGNMVVGLLMIMIFTSGLMAVLLSSEALEMKWQLLDTCQNELLEIQKSNKSSLEELLALNSKAKMLRSNLKTAQRALNVALISENPAAIATAKAAVAAVEAQKKSLDLIQKGIISKANFIAQKKLFKAHLNLRDQLKANKIADVQVSKFEVSGNYEGLAVRPDNAFEAGPVYSVISPFPELQAASLNWSYNFRIGLDANREKMKVTMRDQCSATMREKNKNNFEFYIKQGRPLLKR